MSETIGCWCRENGKAKAFSGGQYGNVAERDKPENIRVAILTGGQDATYAYGLTKALVKRGTEIDFIGSDGLDAPFLRRCSKIRFLNLRGNQREDVSLLAKAYRLIRYYARVVQYAVRSDAPVFHILWNNKIESLDRTLIMLWYRMCGRRLALTAHNVNSAKRDGKDSWFNRATLRCQYALADHIFVHTEKMKGELTRDFIVESSRVSVIPFGLNDETPRSDLTADDARSRLGLSVKDKVALVFGQIAPYKGMEFLVRSLPGIFANLPEFRLVVAGKVKKGHEPYWHTLERELRMLVDEGKVLLRIEHIPDSEVEVYFKAADVLVLPYVRIFQSGLPFLAYSFGLPVVATDAGGLAEDVVKGETGFICRSGDAKSLTQAVHDYFDSKLYESLPAARHRIRERALSRHSWNQVAAETVNVYQHLLLEKRV